MRPASRAVRASGPAWSRLSAFGWIPRRLTRPYVGLRPTMPQHAAGPRMEPPVSVPVAPGQRNAATAAPDPPLEPPGTRSSAHGLRVGPYQGLLVVAPAANSWVLHLPTRTAPAAFNRRIDSASSAGT